MTVLSVQWDSAYLTWMDAQDAMPASLYHWPLLLTWINFNPTLISNNMLINIINITYPFLNFIGYTVEV